MSRHHRLLRRAQIENGLQNGHRGFATHAERDRSVEANKRGDWWHSMIHGAAGIAALMEVKHAGLIDDTETVETLQQHELALAGLFVKLARKP